MRGRPMAIACVGAITASLAAMYVMGKDTKRKEGRESAYKHNPIPGNSDVRMNSSDVSAAVSLPAPGKERLHHQPDT